MSHVLLRDVPRQRYLLSQISHSNWLKFCNYLIRRRRQSFHYSLEYPLYGIIQRHTYDRNCLFGKWKMENSKNHVQHCELNITKIIKVIFNPLDSIPILLCKHLEDLPTFSISPRDVSAVSLIQPFFLKYQMVGYFYNSI